MKAAEEWPKLYQLGGNAFAVTGLYHPRWTVNAGFILTQKSIVHIDAGMRPADGRYLLELSVKLAPGREKLYLILTHHHTDHIFGMRAFRERKAKIIGHRLLGEWMESFWLASGKTVKEIYREKVIPGIEPSKEEEAFLREVELYPPDEVIEGDTVLRIDSEKIHLLYTPGHVPSEISVYHPASKVLFTGDTVYAGMLPTTRFGGPKEWREWIANLESLQKLKIETIVPGHGEICGMEEVERNIAHLRRLLEA
jgi:glyoxylase-like metal-dependent hydrolase (beta-lactamase superfamily II)